MKNYCIPLSQELKAAEDAATDAYWNDNTALGDAHTARAAKIRARIANGETVEILF
jgi:hypothetical protein